MKRVIALVSDLHVFSRYALMCPDFTTVEGNKLVANEGQVQIWESWLSFCMKCDELNVDTVVIPGDLLHGQNPIEMGTLLMSPNTDEQEKACTMVLNPIVHGMDGKKNRKLYVISGSGYHKGSKGHNPEEDVCVKMGGTFWGAIKNVQFAPSKKIFNIAHGESAAFIYREMLLGREGMFLRESQAMGKIPKIDVFVRGHWHNFIYIHEKGMHMIQLPAWMAFEPSKPYLKSYGKMQGDIGGVILMIDDDDRIRVWHYLYPVPHIADPIIEA